MPGLSLLGVGLPVCLPGAARVAGQAALLLSTSFLLEETPASAARLPAAHQPPPRPPPRPPSPPAAFGLPTVALAAIYSALPIMGGSLREQKYMLVGPRCRWLPPPCSMAGPPSTARQPPSGTGGWQPHRPLPRSPSRPPHHRALAPTAPGPALQVGESPRLTAIAEMLEEAVQREHGRGTVLEARKNIFLVDSKARGGGGGCLPAQTRRRRGYLCKGWPP